MIIVTIRHSQLNGYSYNMERDSLPGVGDDFQDDGDIVKVERRVWNSQNSAVELYCTPVKVSRYRQHLAR